MKNVLVLLISSLNFISYCIILKYSSKVFHINKIWKKEYLRYIILQFVFYVTSN